MARIIKSVKEKKWVDIEKDYYELLKETLKDNCEFTAKLLNEQLHFLQEKLVEYLRITENDINEGKLNFNIFSKFVSPPKKEDISVNSHEIFLGVNDNWLNLGRITLLNFNYTKTTSLYCVGTEIEEIHIHGSLKEPENIIFGYGDEQDKNYNEIIEKDDNDLLENIKNLKYSNNSEYNRLMNFLNSDYFQVYIMGHSCGNSDRTLLHTIFEHENCVSIKPFYHEWEEKIGDTEETHIVDNYQDIYANIYRDFENKETCRSKVVPKERCEPLK